MIFYIMNWAFLEDLLQWKNTEDENHKPIEKINV